MVAVDLAQCDAQTQIGSSSLSFFPGHRASSNRLSVGPETDVTLCLMSLIVEAIVTLIVEAIEELGRFTVIADTGVSSIDVMVLGSAPRIRVHHQS